MSLRADAVRTLTAWTAPDAQQETLRREYLTYLRRHPDGTWRSCSPAHLTASALIVCAQRDKVLLVLHGKAGRWLQMGGHCEPEDQSLAQAALREATEESGIHGLRLSEAPVRLDRHPATCGVTHHLDVQYLAFAPPEAVVGVADRVDPVRWYTVDALPDLTDEAVRALVRTVHR